MAEQLTPQQKAAVINRGGKLLVSAAAGSGKTKVLVDRLLSYLTDPVDPANLDDFLIITYTKAAASELRGKIAEKLNERIAQEPNNRHLHRQLQRLYLTKISTVHAFCADILREYAYRLDISADFRVAEETECLDIQYAVLEQILDEAYETAQENPDFCSLVNSQGFGRDDRQIPQILLQVYNSARCHLNPEQWLDWCLQVGDISDVKDAADTIWGKYLLEDLHMTLDLHIKALSRCVAQAQVCSGMEKPADLLQQTITQLTLLRNSQSWDAVRDHATIDYGRLTFTKKCTDLDLAERIKAVRTACKKSLEKKLRRFSDSSEQVLRDLAESISATRGLVALVRKFSDAYEKRKKARRVLDFSDLEHRTLDLLTGKSRNNPTAVATEIGSRYREVMVDEYQDSNAVQDAIFSALTQKRQNCFMVGDVKQSIYQFRLADPGIFLKKYNTFAMEGEATDGQGRKVLLSSNFRSCGAVIDAVNDVFSDCMSPEVGGLFYGEDEALREGLAHIPLHEPEVELHGIQVREDTYLEEAAFVADRISQLLDGKHMIRKGNLLAPITADDIVILLRSPGSVGGDFYTALAQKGIRCTVGGNIDLLQTEEIGTLRALLQIISNPLQDIPLIAVLLSRVFGFTADDLAYIRSKSKQTDFFTALKNSDLPKATNFLEKLYSLRFAARVSNISDLLEQIFLLTRFDSIYSAMPNGQEKVENIRAFCQLAGNFETDGNHDLGHFLEHLEMLQDRGLIGLTEKQTAGAVTIMSIHKSKGLEFPVVFLCGLSREFNRESARAQVLCDREFGLGLCCVDTKNRVRYPTIAKRAIAAKILADGLSEEMRVLYVAMTRAKDRLIMTYASHYLQNEISDLAVRMEESDPLLITSEADCPGKWVLYSALKRTEAGALFALSGIETASHGTEHPWNIRVVEGVVADFVAFEDGTVDVTMPEDALSRIKKGLAYSYAYEKATAAPSKLTATQMKGRTKDQEAAENTQKKQIVRKWKSPGEAAETVKATEYGNAYHAVMQHICYAVCTDIGHTEEELSRLVAQGNISAEQAALVDAQKLATLFSTPIGMQLQKHENVLREFKFSILKDAAEYVTGLEGERILLQGVVDCAIIDEFGITIIDFKSDFVTEETVMQRSEAYRTQVETYADALSCIFQKPIKHKLLYYFCTNQFVSLD